jgi:FkbM family methyltransferase
MDFASYRSGLEGQTSQLGQDAWVLWMLQGKRNGFFVEFGACDGIISSNTKLLERGFNWTGILAEPIPYWAAACRHNRTASVYNLAIAPTSNQEVMFCEARTPELSCIQGYGNDNLTPARKNGIEYPVKTSSLRDLLIQGKAPYAIDYLSIDTEGSEYDIIRDFDFSEYRITLISIEHNYTSNRNKVEDLLSKKGYRHFTLTDTHYDDWYYKI